MSKIARYQGNVRAFASDSQGMERTVFGGTNQADDLTSQITASFLRGWGIVGASEHPSLEDFNAAMYAMSQFIAYQHQMGIAEWHAEQEYHLGSICTHNGESYQSLQNANVGSQPPSAKWTPVLTSKNGLANLGLGSVSLQNVVPASMGGTGATTIVSARSNLGLGSVATENTVPVAKGGTGAIDATSARTNLGITDNSFGLKGMAVFSTAGVTTWTVPDVLKNGRKCEVEVIGGGGSGGRTGGGAAGGGGGGAGGRALAMLDLSGVSSVTVTVGEGGAGITSGSGDSTGNPGSFSSFGSYLSATGGAGGGFPSGGLGGVGSGGDLNTSLGSGSPGASIPVLNAVVSGSGGGAGAAGQTSSVSYNGNTGRGFGGGGSGAATPTAGALGYSGAGYRGVIIVRW